MITTQTLKVKEGSYNSVNFQDYEIISNADVKLLEAFINNKVNLKSFKGKVVFLQDTTFPRFKLTEYSKKNNKIIRTIKDSSADAVILDIEQVKESLKDLPEWIFLPNNDAVDSYQRTWYNSSGQYPKDAIRGRQIKDNQDYYSRRTNFDQIQHLLNLYNNYPNIKIITVQDLTQEVTSDYEAISADWAEKLDPLLGSSDQDAVKLGMTLMTNANFEDSLIYSMLLCNKHKQNMCRNPYFNAVNFKNFRNRLKTAGWGQLENSYHTQSEVEVVQDFLKMKDKQIFKSNIVFIEKLVRDGINEDLSFASKGYKLEPDFKIVLNIDPSRIIDDEVQEVYETSEEIENKENIKA